MSGEEAGSFIGKSTASLAESMTRINLMKKRILFLVDENNILQGTLTDGDIRRYILSGGKIEDSSLAAANPMPVTARSLEEAVLLHQEKYVAIPIVNSKFEIIDIYEGGEVEKKYSKIGIPVVINAGGRGTRLEPFTKVLPKPLIPVGEFPILELIMKEYQKYACSDFHVIVNYKKELIKAYFADVEDGYKVTWYDENKPLGTGGGLSLLRGKMHETFFFANCDVLFSSDYKKMLDYHRDNQNSITMICAYKNIVLPYGVVELGLNGTIECMREKPTMSYLTNTGMYIVEPDVIGDIETDTPISFPDIIELEMKKGKKVGAFPISEEDWMDMGQLSELEKMRKRLYNE